MTIRHLCKEALILRTMNSRLNPTARRHTGMPPRPEDSQFQVIPPTLTAAASHRYLTTRTLLEHLTNGHLHAVDNYLAMELESLFSHYEQLEHAQVFHPLVKLHRKVGKLLRKAHERVARVTNNGVEFYYATSTGQQEAP